MIQMSATFYPAKRTPTSRYPWDFVEIPYEVNFSNSNTRIILEKLGLDPNFEESDPQPIGDFIVACQRFIGGTPYPDDKNLSASSYEIQLTVTGVMLRKVAMLLAAATMGRELGATHWYFA